MRALSACLVVLLACGSCALPRSKSPRAAAPKPPASAQAPASATAGAATPGDSQTSDGAAARELQERLARAHSTRLAVPVRLLRELLRDQDILRTQNRDLEAQLDALKNIDLQQAEATAK